MTPDLMPEELELEPTRRPRWVWWLTAFLLLAIAVIVAVVAYVVTGSSAGAAGDCGGG